MAVSTHAAFEVDKVIGLANGLNALFDLLALLGSDARAHGWPLRAPAGLAQDSSVLLGGGPARAFRADRLCSQDGLVL